MDPMVVTTRPGRRAAAVLAAAVVLWTPGCSHARHYERADLDQLVAKPDEAPPSLVYSPRLSGPVALEMFRSDDAGIAAGLRRAGCGGVFEGILATPDLLDYLVLGQPGARPPKRQELVTTSAVLCATDQGARDALDLFRTDATEDVASDRMLPSQEFGDGSFAVAGTDDFGRPTLLYGWRERNLYQSVEGHGEIDPSDILFIARNMQRRAEALR
jgi:hypothetical protein